MAVQLTRGDESIVVPDSLVAFASRLGWKAPEATPVSNPPAPVSGAPAVTATAPTTSGAATEDTSTPTPEEQA